MQDEDQVDAPADEAADEPDYWKELDELDAAPEAADEFDTDEAADEAAETVEDPTDENPQEDEPDPEEPEKAEPSMSADDEAKLVQKYRSELGRVKASQERAKRYAEELAAVRSMLNTAEPEEPEEDRLAAAKEEWGDVIAPVVEELTDLKKQAKQDRIDGAKQREQTLQSELDAISTREFSVFEQQHPDGFSVLKDHADVFKGWIEDQPKIYRDIYQANAESMVDGEGAALLVSKFKSAIAVASDPQEATPKPTNRLGNRRERQLKGAQSVPRRSRGPLTVEPAPSEDPAAEWDYWERKEKTTR